MTSETLNKWQHSPILKICAILYILDILRVSMDVMNDDFEETLSSRAVIETDERINYELYGIDYHIPNKIDQWKINNINNTNKKKYTKQIQTIQLFVD